VTPGARIAAAIEVLTEIGQRHRPASDALREWGRAHRFAGSGDRAAIGNLVFDVLRQRASLAYRMGDEGPRALALAAVRFIWGLAPDAAAAMAADSPHAPGPLSAEEQAGLQSGSLDGAPDHVAGDIPDWLAPSFQESFGARVVPEGQALAARAPLDLRVNTLRGARDKLAAALKRHGPEPTPLSPVGLRIAAPNGPGRTANVQAEAAFQRGLFEVQDEGSQLAALMAGARSGMQVADICAGAGGKTLALAAAMHGKGQVHAYDADRERLKPIFERIKRARAHNIQVLEPGNEAALTVLEGRMDVVFVDAPCTGSGVWRRRPDAKWRLRPAQLETRAGEQRAVLALAAPLVRAGGRLVYVTCSVLAEENGDQVTSFLKANPDFSLKAIGEVWSETLECACPASADGAAETLLLTPASHGTDGFFVAVLEKR